MARRAWSGMGAGFDDCGAFKGMGDFFDDAFKGFGDLFGGGQRPDAEAEDWTPAVDIVEREGSVEIFAEIPGVTEKDVNISVTGNVITLRGEKKRVEGGDEGKEHHHRTEREYGSFRRSFTLPAGLQLDAVKATYRDGVLVISVPKTEHSQSREIRVDVE